MYLTIYLLVIHVYCRIIEAFANYAHSHFAEPLKHILTKIIEQNLSTSSLIQRVKHWGLIMRNQLWISPREHYARAWLAQIDKHMECTFNYAYKHETWFYGNTFRITGPFCEEPRVTGGFPQKGSVMRSLDVTCDVSLNTLLCAHTTMDLYTCISVIQLTGMQSISNLTR